MDTNINSLNISYSPRRKGYGIKADREDSRYTTLKSGLAANTFSQRRCHKIEHNGEERYRSGHLLSPTFIEEGRLVSY